MSSASVVVIILVVVVAAVAGATLKGGPQPATRHEPRDDAPPAPDDLAFPAALPVASPAPVPAGPHDLDDDLELDDEGVPEVRGARERLGALGRLLVTVVVLGGAAAALVGGGALLGYRFVDRALG